MSLCLQQNCWKISSKNKPKILFMGPTWQISIFRGGGGKYYLTISALKQPKPQTFQHELPLTAPFITSTWPKLTFLLCWGHSVITEIAFLKKVECELCRDMQTIILLFHELWKYIPQQFFSRYQKADSQIQGVSNRIYNFSEYLYSRPSLATHHSRELGKVV